LVGDVAARTGLVVDDDRHAQLVPQLLANEAGCCIGSAARRKPHHDGQGFFDGKVLGLGLGLGHRPGQQCGRRAGAGTHAQKNGACSWLSPVVV
jgi:hypothetical protein